MVPSTACLKNYDPATLLPVALAAGAVQLTVGPRPGPWLVELQTQVPLLLGHHSFPTLAGTVAPWRGGNKKLFAALAAAGCTHYTLHPMRRGQASSFEDALQQMVDFQSEARDHGVTVAFETMFRPRTKFDDETLQGWWLDKPAEVFEFLDVFGPLSLVVDAAHLYIEDWSDPDVSHLTSYGTVLEKHLSGNNGVLDQHTDTPCTRILEISSAVAAVYTVNEGRWS